MNYQEKKLEIEKNFNGLSKQKDELVKKINEITEELIRIQGEYRLLDKLEKEEKEEKEESKIVEGKVKEK